MRWNSITHDIRAELDAINKANDGLTEELVVQASKKKSSALHPLFLWDNPEEAAHIGRLEIARKLIMRVRIIAYEVPDTKIVVDVRKYHGTGNGYNDIDTVMSSEALRALVVQNAIRDLENLEHKYAHIRQIAAVFAGGVRALKEEIKRLEEAAV